GEAGPAHQAVEHYASLRAMPNMWFMRPGDGNETVAAWRVAVERRGGPVALSLTRQKVPTLTGTAELAREGVARGGYVLREAGGDPGWIEGRGAGPHVALCLIGTGSELQLAMGAAEVLEREGTPTRVVSMPCWELFEQQPPAYREAVLPSAVRHRVSVEAGASLGWERWVGTDGAIVG